MLPLHFQQILLGTDLARRVGFTSTPDWGKNRNISDQKRAIQVRKISHPAYEWAISMF